VQAAEVHLGDVLEQSPGAAPSQSGDAAGGTSRAPGARCRNGCLAAPRKRVRGAAPRCFPDGLLSKRHRRHMASVGRTGKTSRAGSLCFAREHQLFTACIMCYLSPWCWDALLTNFSNVHFIITICNRIFRHFFHFLHTYKCQTQIISLSLFNFHFVFNSDFHS